MKYLWRVCVLLAFVSGGLFFVSCKKTEVPRPFHVGIATWPGFAPGFVAKEKGFFGTLPVDFSILDDFTVRQNAFTSGKTQATISTLDSFAFESGQGVKGRVVLVLDESFGADAIVASTRIKSPQALKGKKVAYVRGSPSHFFLIQYLEKNRMDISGIVSVQVDDPGRAGEAFVSGSVDAAVTWEPNITQIVNSGKGHVLESTRTAPGLIVDVLVVSPDVYETRKQDIQVFIDGWLRAVEYVKTTPSDAYSIMARNLKIPEKDFPGMAAGLKYADITRNKELLLGSPQAAARIFNQATEIWREEKLISSPQSGERLITPEFIEKR